MNENSKLLPAIIIVTLFALVFGSLGFLIGKGIYQNNSDGLGILNFGGQSNEPRDVFGTTIGKNTTSTTNIGTAGYPSDWPNSDFSDVALNDAGYPTTSKAVLLDGQTDTVLFTFLPITASSTGYFSYDIFGTNDNLCTTTATSTTDDNYNPIYPLVSEINWYDIEASGTRVSGSFTNGNVENPGNATSTSRLLTNLNWKCLRVDLRGASTTVGVQLREKIQ